MTTGKHVHFESVQIREYPFVLGDNPGSRHGPSFELGWEYRYVSELMEIKPCVITDQETTRTLDTTRTHETEDEETPTDTTDPLTLQNPKFSIDDYESIRPSSHRPGMKQLYMHPQTRLRLVRKNQNYTDDEIQEAMKAKQMIIQSRARSKIYPSLVAQFREGNVKARRTKKIKRAVRNLKKTSQTNDQNTTKRSGRRSRGSNSIYSGWWLPLSHFLF